IVDRGALMVAPTVRPVTRSLNPVSHKRSPQPCLVLLVGSPAGEPLLRRHPLGAGHEANEVTKLPARLPGTSAVTNHPLVVHRYIHRASIHRDGGPKTALHVTNAAARASKDSRTISAILDRLCLVIMFAPPTRECLHSPSSINAHAPVRFRTWRSQASLLVALVQARDAKITARLQELINQVSELN